MSDTEHPFFNYSVTADTRRTFLIRGLGRLFEFDLNRRAWGAGGVEPLVAKQGPKDYLVVGGVATLGAADQPRYEKQVGVFAEPINADVFGTDIAMGSPHFYLIGERVDGKSRWIHGLPDIRLNEQEARLDSYIVGLLGATIFTPEDTRAMKVWLERPH
jgi:hypothetical protein